MKPSNEKPDAAEMGQLRAYLAQQGCTQAQIKQATGTATVNFKTRGEYVELLKTLCKSFPKAV